MTKVHCALFCSDQCKLSMSQGMVDRSDLLAALSENKTLREDAQANEKDLAWSETQLGKAREQLDLARLVESQLRLELSSMVPRSDLETSRAEARELNEDNTRLEQKLLEVKIEINDLKVKIEVLHISYCR